MSDSNTKRNPFAEFAQKIKEIRTRTVKIEVLNRIEEYVTEVKDNKEKLWQS